MTNVDNHYGQSRIQQQQAVTRTAAETKAEIGKVVNALLSLIPEDAESRKEITRIAESLYKYADEHAGAVGQAEFSKLLKQITPENVVGVIMKYNEDISPNETIIEMMLDEVGSNIEDINEALIGDGTGKNELKGIFTVLLDRAKAVGMDDGTIKAYREQFETQLKKEMRGAAFLRSSAKMDEIIMTVIQSINNHIDEKNRAQKEENKAPVAAKVHETKATNSIVKRHNRALKDFNAQLKADGWAEDVADAMGRIWGENYADAVRRDLNVSKKEIDRLKAALAKGDEAFRAEFAEIFGVTYDPANITAFENAEAVYTAASQAKANEDSFTNNFSLLLNGNPLAAETTSSTSTSIKGEVYTSQAVVKKEEVYQREFDKVAKLFDGVIKNDSSGQFALLGITSGESYVEKAFEAAGVKDKSIDDKYKVLATIVKGIKNSLTEERKKACGGRSFDDIKQRYETCYNAAFGLENNILKRVTDYNISQQKGGGMVKGTAVAVAAIGIGLLTAGTGAAGAAGVAGGAGAATAGGVSAATIAAGAVKSGAVVALASATAEITDKFTSGEALEALRNKGVLAFLEKGCEVTDWKQVAKASLVSGAMCVAFAGEAYALTNITFKAATVLGAGAETAGYTAAGVSTAGFIGTGMGIEYLLTGDISVEGTAFTVVLALVSGTLQVIQVHKAAQLQAQTKAEQFAAEVQNAKATLGIPEDVELTAEMLKEARNAAIKVAHPDLVGEASTNLAQQINGAYKFLMANMANINAKVVPAPAAQSSSGNYSPVSAEEGVIVPRSHYQVSPDIVDIGFVGAAVALNSEGSVSTPQVNPTENISVEPGASKTHALTITGNEGYTNREIKTIYEHFSDINELVNEYVNVDGEKFPVQKAILQEIIEQRSGMNVNDAVKVHTENVPAKDYKPIVPYDSGYSNDELTTIYESVADINDLISEYTNTNNSDFPARKIILKDIIEQRTGMNITKALQAANNGTIVAADTPSPVVIPFNPKPQVGAIAASGAGPVANPSLVNGGAGNVEAVNVNPEEVITNAQNNVVSTESYAKHSTTTTYGKDANGKNVIVSIKQGNVEGTTYIDGDKAVNVTQVAGKEVGKYIHDGQKGVYFDANGNVITEQAFSDMVAKASIEAHNASQQAPTGGAAKVTAETDITSALSKLDAQTQQAVNDGLIRIEYINDVEKALENSKTTNLVRNTMYRAKTQAELQYFADKFKNSDNVADRYTALIAEQYKDTMPVKPSQETFGTTTGHRQLPEGNVANNVSQKSAITVPEGTSVEQARAKIAELQEQLKAYGAGTDRYDQIHMDKIQAEIKAYREIAPLDRTNLQEVLKASPDEVFQPVKADNIKGQGISFKPYVPEDPEALAKVTYRAVPVFCEARTVEEMINLAARSGVKIELVQDADGNYFPGVKSVWSEGSYFKLDRDSYVVQYGEIPADDPYVDQAWAQQNKYTNADGKEVIMDCAIVASDKKTAADIMPHSYVKESGAQVIPRDKYDWDGFQAHKDPNGVVNAVAYNEPQELQTLEGKITTDVTMGDVEGNVYNKYNDLKKQIIKDKLIANPEDPNSQKFIDLVKAGNDDEAIALLREATKASQQAKATTPELPTAVEENTAVAQTAKPAEVAPTSEPAAPTGGQPRELKLPKLSGGTQADIVEGWAEFARESKAVINSAQSIDELRTLRDQIKNVEHKQCAQELREAYIAKEQELRAALPQESKDIENMYRPDGSPSEASRQRILAEAGFSDGVIDDIIANGPWGDPKIDAKLMEEVKNMVIWMEGEIENGASVNKALIESAIQRFSPGASGGSSACQRSILANYWKRGTEVYNAYGQKAPGQSTFSWGNLKAKWNQVKDTVKEFYEYKKFMYGIEDSPASGSDAIQKYADWSTESLMNEFNARYNYGIKDGTTDLRAELISRGYAPNENGYFLTDEIVPADGAASTAPAKAPVVTGGAASTEAPLSNELRLQLLNAMKDTKIKDTSVITDMMAKHPDFVRKLAAVQGPDGKPLFNPKNIDLVLANLPEVIETKPEKIWAILSNPEEVKDIAGWKSPAAGLWRATSEPLQSTIDANPELFGKAPTGGAAPVQASEAQVPVVSSAAEEVHSGIVNGKFGAFGSKSVSKVGAELKAYAEQNGLEFIDHGSEFELRDANGNVVREAHEGFFDGQWYDHHQVFNENNQITNRFVVDHDGKLQSTVEFFYDEAGEKTMSVGYGGKAGKDVMVFEGSNRTKLTIQQFIDKYGFEPTYYREINPTVEFESPVKAEVAQPAAAPTQGAAPTAPVQAVVESGAKAVSPMEADTGIKPFGEMSFEEAMPQIEQYAKENGLTITNRESLFGDAYDLTNSQGQKVRTVVFDKGKVDIEWNRTFDANGKRTNETMYDAEGKVIETTDYKYDDNGNIVASIKLKSGYDEVGVFEYNSNGRVSKDYFISVEKAEAKFGKLSHTEIIEGQTPPTEPTPPSGPSGGKPISTTTAPAAEAPAQTAQAPKAHSAEFEAQLAEFKGPDGKAFLTQSEITDLIENCQHGFITDGKPIPDYEAKIMAVLNNPEELQSIKGWNSKTAGIWRAIQDPLGSTVDANPELFGRTSGVTTEPAPSPQASDFASQLADFKGPDGKAFLTQSEITDLIENCQHGFVTDGEPIPDYEAKIMAVLNNPEEIQSIKGWNSKTAGIWRAIQDPLASTVDANPELFGRTSGVTTESAPATPAQAAELKHEVGHVNEPIPDAISTQANAPKAAATSVQTMNSHQKAEILDRAFTPTASASDNVAAAEILLVENDSKIVRSEVTENPRKESFYDSKGNVVKINYLNEDNSVRGTEVLFSSPRRNGVTKIYKSGYQIEINEHKPWVSTFDGAMQEFDRSYREFTLDGKPIRDVYATKGVHKMIPDSYEVRYDSEGKVTSVKQEVYSKGNSKETTFVDYEKGTKRIEKSDKNWKRYEVSETGIDDTPEFYTKQDVIRRSADAWVGFPSMKQAVADSNFDCVSTQTVVETLRKQPEACQKIISLKNPDGTPRFTPEEAATLILNCKNFLDTPRLMKFMTTPNADGSPREVYEIWRGYVDSDEFKDVAVTEAVAEPKSSPIDDKVTIAMGKAEVQEYIEKVVNTKGDTDALNTLLKEVQAQPDTPESRAIESSIIKCIMGFGQNTEHVSDFVKTALTKILTEEAAKDAALASINKNAVLSDDVYASAFELSPKVSASDKRHVAELMKANAGIVEKMMTYKNPDGSQMFTPKVVAEFFLNCESVIVEDPGRIFTTIESDLFQKDYADCENKSAALWKCLYY